MIYMIFPESVQLFMDQDNEQQLTNSSVLYGISVETNTSPGTGIGAVVELLHHLHSLDTSTM